MKAHVVPAYKKAVVLSDVPEPEVGEHDVLVDIRAAGVNIGELIDITFPFSETVAALAHVQSGRSKGKVVVTAEEGLA